MELSKEHKMSVVLFVCFILTNVHKRSMKKRQSFQQMLLEKLDIHGRKNKNKQTNKKNIKKKKNLDLIPIRKFTQIRE